MKIIFSFAIGLLFAASMAMAAGLHDWSQQEATVGIMVPHLAYNPATVVSYNAAGDVVYVDETYNGETWRQSFNPTDTVVTSTKTISVWVKQ